MSKDRINGVVDLITKMGVNVTTGKGTKDIFESLVEYFKGIDTGNANMIGIPFMFPKGTSLSNNAANGLAIDVVGFALRDKTTVYIYSMMNGIDEPAVLSRVKDHLPDGTEIQVDQYLSEVFDDVYAAVLKEQLPIAMPDMFAHKFKTAIIAEPVILRNTNPDDKDWIDRIITKGISLAVSSIVALSPDGGRTGIKAMTNSSGEPLFTNDKKKPILTSTISRPVSVEKFTENGVPLDPIMVLTIKEKDKDEQATARTLNVVSRENSVLSAGVTASMVYLGPEDPNAAYKREPQYRSFATQLIVDSTDHGAMPSLGKTLMSIAGVTDLTPVSLQKKMFEPESLSVLDLFVNSKGEGNGYINHTEMSQNYDQYFDMFVRPNPVIAMRIIPGTTSAVVESAFLSGREAINASVAEFFNVKVEDLPPGLRDVDPVLSVENSLLGTFTDDSNEQRSLSNIDNLYVFNTMGDDPQALNRWLLASSGGLSPGVSRYIKQEIIHNITKSRYEVTDVSVLVSLDPRWVNGLAEAFRNYFVLESNAHSFSSFDSSYTPYMDVSGYNSYQYNQNMGGVYGGYAGGNGYYTHIQHNGGALYY